jgi:hypothetical protein
VEYFASAILCRDSPFYEEYNAAIDEFKANMRDKLK